MTATVSNNLLSGNTDEGYEIKAMASTDDAGFGAFIASLVVGDIFITANGRSFQGKTITVNGVTSVVAAYENTSPMDVEYSQSPVKNFQISS